MNFCQLAKDVPIEPLNAIEPNRHCMRGSYLISVVILREGMEGQVGCAEKIAKETKSKEFETYSKGDKKSMRIFRLNCLFIGE